MMTQQGDTTQKEYPLLTTIQSPEDVRALSQDQLTRLCDEVRQFLIASVARTGGHFGSNLGVVELTVALHRVFHTPHDDLVWDVGHQAYPHKILTGRRDRMHTIRTYGGLSPFPKRAESIFDAFDVGHSSTSISAALGMALSDRDKKHHHVAVIGDGALTGGMAYEALNHAGDVDANLLVILNDNEMSISPNVGAMHNYLTRLISSRPFTRLRQGGKKLLKGSHTVHEVARRAELYAKGMITPGTLFEELGFAYFGPVDGHDLETLIAVLENLRKLDGPRFLHVVTKKGYGYKFAADDATSLHAVSPFDPRTGRKHSRREQHPTYTDAFGTWICNAARSDVRVHAITPAMCEGSGLAVFRKRFSKRYHDVGIAEQHAVTLAAGLAAKGLKPVVSIYSTFLQRAYDQVIHDVALQNLDVTFAIDRAGVVGPDGATHAGVFDYAYLRCIPNMTVMAPADVTETASMLTLALESPGPAAVRYPRDSGLERLRGNVAPLKIGKAAVISKGSVVAILAFGAMVERCMVAAQSTGATMVNMRFIKPLDIGLLKRLAKTHTHFITVEDHAATGGAGSAVMESCAHHHIDVKITALGLPDTFLPHGSRDDILAQAQLSEQAIADKVATLFATT